MEPTQQGFPYDMSSADVTHPALAVAMQSRCHCKQCCVEQTHKNNGSTATAVIQQWRHPATGIEETQCCWVPLISQNPRGLHQVC